MSPFILREPYGDDIEGFALADFKYNHHLYWGKTYRLADVQVDWHLPADNG